MSSISGSTRLTALLVAVLAALTTGCGSSKRPPLAPVKGRVLCEGQSLSNVTVTFVSTGAARWSYGKTNDQGEFTLTTYEPNDGAIVGMNKVAISQPAHPTENPPPAVPDPEDYFHDLKESLKPDRATLPARYTDINTSGLSYEVHEGENSFEIKISKT